MVDGQLKLSRRALLGVACASAPVLAAASPSSSFPRKRESSAALYAAERVGLDPRFRGDDGRRWQRALALFTRADAAVAALEGTSDDDAFNAAADAHDRALERLLLAPAPDLAALARKLRLARRDQAWELPSGDALMDALEQDAHRLSIEAPGMATVAFRTDGRPLRE